MSGTSESTSVPHELRTDYYYAGCLRLRRSEDEYRGAVLEWEAYSGGKVELDLDYDELAALSKACEQLRVDLRAEMPWLKEDESGL